ncbi:YciI family protein [Nocardia sp. CDC159]|uniref:YciI family protein n=1 Tax=Nocardia pulmonis TaxID=2951408 RepID=A0A9X2IXR1_9NOCA|nr:MULTISPECIES: YciI family protein [Nocardia]MCM6774145.1 YciI family protein [Nocardia pulmonis]MCM6787032.1 YciI family protein [Nocardia sp. CDC159]
MALFAVHYTYSEATAARRAEHRPEHRGWLSSLVEQGVVLTSGPYQDGSGALIVFRAEDGESMGKLLAQDPFAQHGLIDAVRFVEWQPVLGAFTE